ncbi:MAG: hypothetical protein IJG60_03865 [Thermoguttaceae bacterium]|nr:hypothetical protein [Thermoguttaceae bacterium]
MKRCRCLVFVFLSLFALFAAPQAALPGDSEKDALLDRLRRAREDWIQNASFCGHFTLRHQVFSSEEEAMAAETPVGGIRAHGFIAKLNHKYRLQTIHEHDDNVKVIGPLSEDTVANDRFGLTVSYMINTIDDTQPSFDGGLEKALDPNYIPSRISEYGLPCSFFSDRITAYAYAYISETDFNIECTRKEDGRYLLTIARMIPDIEDSVEELTIRTDGDSPVVEQITRTRKDSERTMKTVSKVLEWRDCGGFAVPVRTRTVQGIQFTQQEGMNRDHWQMSEWVSEDLGERPPREKDFAVKVQWGDILIHLKKPWWKRTIHIDKLTDRNYDPEIPDFLKNPDKYPPRKKRLSEEDLYLKLGCSAAGLALIALALVMKYRARKKKAASA